MNSFIIFAFAGLFSVLGVEQVPGEFKSTWQVETPWQKQGELYYFKASAEDIVSRCRANKDHVLIMPQVIHSAQNLFLDGRQVAKFGDPEFKRASPFYEQVTIECSRLISGAKLTWEVYSYSYYFSRFNQLPYLATSAVFPNLLNVTANSMAFGILLVLSLFTFIIYRGRVPDNLTYCVSFGALFMSLYFLNAANSQFGFGISMLNSHKMADIGLWIGGILFLRAFEIDGLMSKWISDLVSISCVLGLTFISLGQSGDQVQFGTMIPMFPYTLASVNIIYRLVKITEYRTINRDVAIKIFSVLMFIVFGMNDILHIMGVTKSVMMLSIGIVGCVLGLSIAVVRAIEVMYQERDDLLQNLERKVNEKTVHLEEALNSLKSTQAELVQSAKLASLGTLSAGIAHEINNAINYVNGALVPLEKKINTHIPLAERPMIDKLLAAIKEGTSLTVEIVKSLRNYTGLNQAELKDVLVSDAIRSVTTILKSKLRDVEFILKDPIGIHIHGNLVGLNQIFMNLITNSLDAFDKPQRKISIECLDLANGEVEIVYNDNGSGIPDQVMKRIFDPFYTTKEVGRGTGLGLHIVKKEIEKHGGTISVVSQVGQGTEFRMKFPIDSHEFSRKLEAA